MTTAKQSKKIVEIVSVVDTRDYEEVNDRWRPVPGSGELNECTRCGRLHEVHATVRLDDDSCVVVGTGCMKAESDEIQSRIKTLVAASKTIARLDAQQKRITRLVSESTDIWRRVDALPQPKIEIGYGVDRGGVTRTKFSMGDVVELRDTRTETFDRDCETIRAIWKRRRREELGYTREHDSAIDDLREVERKIARTKKRMEAR